VREAFRQHHFFLSNANRDHGLASNVDTIRGRHANQHIPQITGALETFRGTKEMPYYNIAANFWEMVNSGYMYSIGGVAGARTPNNAECFTAQPNTLWENGFANGGQNETCATYNMLKLDRQLFMYDQTAKYMDHYERALYNHILTSVAEENAGNTYHVPLNPGAQKRFGNARMNGFTCCNGTALESNSKLQDTIYFRSADNRALYVNLFIPSTLNWSERKIVVQQMTDFPYADTTKLVVKGSGQSDMKVRVPKWATHVFFVKINGQDQKLAAVPRQLHDHHQELARERHGGAADAVRLRTRSRHGSAERRQHLLWPGAARRRGVRATVRLAPGHLGCLRPRQVDHRRPSVTPFYHRRHYAETVPRVVRSPLGLQYT